jgi:hypothetical protein
MPKPKPMSITAKPSQAESITKPGLTRPEQAQAKSIADPKPESSPTQAQAQPSPHPTRVQAHSAHGGNDGGATMTVLEVVDGRVLRVLAMKLRTHGRETCYLLQEKAAHYLGC